MEEAMGNLWKRKMVAFAYQYQRDAAPYKEMLGVFSSCYEIKGGEKILDIGCGSGRIIKLSIDKAEVSGKNLHSIIGTDNSKEALRYARKNMEKICAKNINFLEHDISSPLPFESSTFDLVTAGLSLQYAEYHNGERWTTEGYVNILREIKRVLAPGGKLIFSVNVPNPDFSIIAKKSWKEIFLNWKLPLYLIVAIIMVSQGKWLTQQANIGRFNYLPIADVKRLLKLVGFGDIKYQQTYAGLAWVISCS